MDKLSHDAGFVLIKGASDKVIECGKTLAKQVEPEQLKHFCKLHFKTLESVISYEECQQIRENCQTENSDNFPKQ